MAIVQKYLHIPDEVMTKVSTGEYKILGGEVRNNKGQIVKLLRPINKWEAAFYYGWKYRKIIFGVGKLGVAYYKTYILKKKDKENILKFNDTLKLYLNAIRKDTLTIEIFTDLMETLNEIKEQSNFSTINLALSIEELDLLMNGMFEYTTKLATDKATVLTKIEKEKFSQSEDPIINLQNFLEAQKRFFEMAS